MAFLKSARITDTAHTVNSLIDNADARITELVAIKAQLVQWSQTLANNTTDFTNADRAEFTAELVRLNNRLENEL